MSNVTKTQGLMRAMRLVESANELPEFIKVAEKQQLSYTQFLLQVMEYEKKRREEKGIEKYLKWANFPIQQTLDSFSLTDQPTIKTKQFNQLKDLGWLDQLYNLILLGPSGVGKTHIAIGLGIKAVQEGYRVTFVTMAEVIQLLKTEEISRKSQIRLKRLRESNLVIIDDLMFIAMDRREANLLFHLINHLYNAASVIITSNKGPSEWGELLGDPAIAAAIMDRLVHRSEVIQLKGDSYRVKHRTSIFEE